MKKFIITIYLFFILAPHSVQAAILPPDFQINIPGLNLSTNIACTGTDKSLCVPWISEYIIGIYNYALGIAGILAAIMIMWGGIVWLTAGGNQQRVGEAKKYITGSITGLILLFASYTILYFINPNFTIFGPLKISQIEKAELPEGKEVSSGLNTTRTQTTYIIIHASGNNTMNRNDIDAFHRSKGWDGIGYNLFIERGGNLVAGRGEDAVGAHVEGYNTTSLGIAYAGCSAKNPVANQKLNSAIKNGTITQTQLNTLIKTIKDMQAKYKIPKENVKGHIEFGAPKACPCLDMDEIRSKL